LGLVPGASGLPGDAGDQPALVARLRAVIEAKDAEIAALRAALGGLRADMAAEHELVRRLELRVAELERQLGTDSTDSGTPPSKEPIGARERRTGERKARQASERERRKDRKRGGQPGHAGSSLARDPDPGERKTADPAGPVLAVRGRPGRREARGVVVGAGLGFDDQGSGSKVEQAVLGLTALGNMFIELCADCTGSPSTPSSGTPPLWRTTTRPANRSGDVGGLPTWRTWPPWW